MNKLITLLTATIIVMTFATKTIKAQQPVAAPSDTLVVVWTSGDVEVAEKMVFMYVHNAKRAGWFKEVVFIVWGPSAKLLSENEDLQEEVKAMGKDGIILEACTACARMYGVNDKLAGLGIDVKGMGVPLSNYLKNGYRVISF